MEQLAKVNRNAERYSFQPHILVIDDDESILDLIQDILSLDYFVSTASDAQKGLEMLGQDRFDLLILDLGLPGVSGIDLIRYLRMQEKYANLPILVLSAYMELASRLADLTVDDVLAKPFALAQLERQVAKLVRRDTDPVHYQDPAPALQAFGSAC